MLAYFDQSARFCVHKQTHKQTNKHLDRPITLPLVRALRARGNNRIMGRYLGILKRTSFQNICFRTDGTSLNSIRMVPGKLSVSHLTRTVLPSSSHLRYLSGQYIYLYQVYHQQIQMLIDHMCVLGRKCQATHEGVCGLLHSSV